MQNKTLGKESALQLIQDKAIYAFNSLTREAWLENFNKNERYKRGDQWHDPVLNKQIKEMGAIPFTMNIIRPEIDKYLSLIIRATKRVGFAPTNNSENDKNKANILKYWSMNVLTQNEYPFYSQLKIEDTIVGGLGCSEFYYENGKYSYKYKNPRECYPDPDDLTPRMDNQNTIVCSQYINSQELKNKYPNHKKFFDDLVDDSKRYPDDSNNYSIFLNDNSSNNNYSYNYSMFLNDDIKNKNWIRGKSIRVVEVYYKKNVKYFECVGVVKSPSEKSAGEQFEIGDFIVFETFDEQFAIDNAYENQIEEKIGTRIYKGVYVQDTLLEHGPIPEQMPNQKYLPILFMVYKRDYMGVPYGLIDDLIPRQNVKNLNITTFMHYKDAKLLIASNSQGDVGKNLDYIIEQTSKKRGAIFLPEAEKAQLLDNNKNSQQDLSLLQYLDADWQRATNLYDEFSGMINRETSGAAVQQLTLNTINSHNFLMLAYNHMVVTEGRLMLDTLKGTKNIDQIVKYYKNGKNETHKLDSEISLLNFEVYPEASPNFSSTVEEEKMIFNQISSSQNPSYYLNSPLFLQQIGVSEETAYAWAEEWHRIKIAEQKIAMEAQLEMQQMRQMQQQESKNQS